MLFLHPETKSTVIIYPDPDDKNDQAQIDQLLNQGFERPEELTLVNPGGRIIDAAENEYIGKLLDLPDDQQFRLATQAEADSFHAEQNSKFQQYKAQNLKTSIYFQTVSGKGRSDGYGRSSEVLVRELMKHGVGIDEKFNNQKVGLIYHNPIPLAQLDTPYRILMTMFESDRIPDEWKDHLALADQIIVPSKWCAETFKRAGFDTTVLPLGYDAEKFTFVERPKRRTFTFLHYDGFNIRKGFQELFNAFTEEFKPDEPVKLIIKTVRDSMPSEFPIMRAEYPNIEVIYGQVSEADLQNILAESDCFVFPSLGEGFGMTPLEAMATGIPPIVPNAHGISEYFNSDCMIEVETEGLVPAIYHRWRGVDVGKMVQPSVKDLRKKMRWAVDNQDAVREMGLKASEYAKDWTLQKSAELLAEIIDEAHELVPERREIRDVLPVKKI
jgi:glycosyltransferase involved in cell wall biosynthesis